MRYDPPPHPASGRAMRRAAKRVEQVILQSEGGELRLTPFDGDKIIVDGWPRKVPKGVTFTMDGLDPNKDYFILYLPIATQTESNTGGHWAAKARRAKKQRADAYTLTGALKSLPLPATISLVRVSPRALDDDNLRSAIKHVRDGIADRLGIDDRDPRVKWEYGQRKGSPKERAVIVQAHSDKQ